MREYKRLHARSAARVTELSRRKAALEAGLQGIEVCWSEVRNHDRPFRSAPPD